MRGLSPWNDAGRLFRETFHVIQIGLVLGLGSALGSSCSMSLIISRMMPAVDDGTAFMMALTFEFRLLVGDRAARRSCCTCDTKSGHAAKSCHSACDENVRICDNDER